jgi:predicted RND superfamily exporter protein
MTLAERLSDFVLKRRWWLFCGLAAVLVLLAAGLPRLQVSDDNRAFFGAANQEFVDLQRNDETYTLSTVLLLMVIPPEGTAFDPDTLRALQQMTEDAWQMPYALRVDSPINHMHSYAIEDEILVEPMLDEFADVTPEAAERFRELALASDDMRNMLLSADGTAYGITVRMVLPEDQPGIRRQTEAALRDMIGDWRAELPGWEIRATGAMLGNNLLARVAVEDIAFLVPLAFLAVTILFALAMGSALKVIASLSVLFASTVATYGFAGWTGVELTAGTAISPLAVMVLVSTSCVHIILAWIRTTEGGVVANPFRHALSENMAPVTVSHLTTAFGFLCLNFSPAPPLADMGNIVAFGLIFGHLAVFIILPTFLAGRQTRGAGRLMVTGDQMRRFAAWVIRRKRIWLAVFPVAVSIAVLGITRIAYDDNVIRYFDHRYELRQDSEAVQARLTGLESLQFSFQAPDGASVFDPEFLYSIDRFVIWLERQSTVVSVTSLTDIIKDLNQNMSGGDPNAHAVADSQAANAQLLMFYELSLPVGMDLNVMMDVDRTQTLVTAVIRSSHSAEIRAVASDAEAWLAENEPEIATRASGIAIAFARISERNNSQMLAGFLLVLVLVSITMMATLRSLRYGALSLVPNLIPAIMAFGFWGMTLGDLNLGSTVVTTMTFGIVVDDTVHFLMHYLRGRRRGLHVQAALEETFAVVGSAITLTSVALIIGFVIMAASGFAINQHIGLLTSVVIFFALLSDLLLLPALLALFQGNSK